MNTKFIRNELIGPSLCGCDITFKELREKPGSYFIEIPVDAPPDIADRYYRLIIAGALAEMLSDDCLGKTPVLFVLDEAAGLGRLAALEQAITMARGFGIQIWSVFTDIPTMQRLYREGFRSFLANCGCAMFFPPNDMTTCEEISRLSGTTEIVSQSRSYIVDPETGEPRVTEGMGQHGSRPLLLPHEVRELGSSGKSELLIIAQGVKGIIRAKRRPYWKTHPGKYCPDPYEKGKRH